VPPEDQGSAGLEAPAAQYVPLVLCRAQAERFGRHAADAELDASDLIVTKTALDRSGPAESLGDPAGIPVQIGFISIISDYEPSIYISALRCFVQSIAHVVAARAW
jgi:hypothetical protein